MANYINLTLDTTAPAGVTVKINDDETRTSSRTVQLTITCSDSDKTGYQMKIWGTAQAVSEGDATWEAYSESKTVTLPSGSDGSRTVKVKVRDDVWNESAIASDSILFYGTRPTVTNITSSTSKVSLVEGKDCVTGSIFFDETIDVCEIMFVNNINAEVDDPSNVDISISNTSKTYLKNPVTNEVYTGRGGLLRVASPEAEDHITCGQLDYSIGALEINNCSPGDGAKIIKVFIHSATSGLWSV